MLGLKRDPIYSSDDKRVISVISRPVTYGRTQTADRITHRLIRLGCGSLPGRHMRAGPGFPGVDQRLQLRAQPRTQSTVVSP